MKLLILGPILALFAPFTGPAAGLQQRIPVLAELFTSEGCSSCPPADSLLMRLDQMQPVSGAQIIVLSEHVDYWNRLGWADPFSSPQFSARQATYARALRSEVYTPQLVIDGREEFIGSDASAIQAAIGRAASRPKTAVQIVAAQQEGSEGIVTLSAGAGQGDIWIAVADERDESSVKRGENSGRRLPHVAVVRSLVKIGTLSGTKPFEKMIRVPLSPGAKPDGTRIVAFLADPAGPIIGASMARLKP
jgi:hypothetical protein